MDTVLLLLFVSGMSLIVAALVVGSRFRTGTARRSPRKASRKSTGASNKQKQKTRKQRKSRYNLDNEDLLEMIFENAFGARNKHR